MKTNIAFLGVWDTVAALGFPNRTLDVLLNPFFKHHFHNFDLGGNVECARHALSIDDERKTFHPKLWSVLKNDDNNRMKQVWFAGVHTDVGGGYKQRGLSDISLQWMMDEARAKGLIIYEESDNYKEYLKMNEENVNDVMHDEQASCLGKIYSRAQRAWCDDKGNPRGDQPIIHESVLSRTRSSHNQRSVPYSPWIIKGISKAEYEIEKWTTSKTES